MLLGELLLNRKYITLSLHQQSVFLDDMPGNVQAAIRAGLHGFWVRSEQEMGAFFTGANE